MTRYGKGVVQERVKRRPVDVGEVSVLPANVVVDVVVRSLEARSRRCHGYHLFECLSPDEHAILRSVSAKTLSQRVDSVTTT